MSADHSPGQGTLPLSDLTVVDLTQVIAGPFATMTLADLGAEVIKIEAIERGDRARSIEPIPEYYDSVNRNKRSVAIDLKRDRGQDLAMTLLEGADVFIESAKPGRVERYGLAYENVVAVNPSIIYCSISGFGTDSQYGELPAWDMLIQAMSGIMSMAGDPSGPPMWSGLPSGDLIAASYAVQSVLAALYARETGRIDSEWIEVPMLDAAISWLTARAGYTFGTDEAFPRNGSQHPSIAPFGVFDCSDGMIVIAAGTPSLWRGFCEAIDRPDLLDADRFATMSARVANADALRETIEPILSTATRDVWVEAMRERGVPAGPIYDTRSVWEDEYVQSRGLRRVLPRADREDATVIDHPIHFSQLVTRLHSAPEGLGRSTDAVLRRHGVPADEIDAMRRDDVIG